MLRFKHSRGFTQGLLDLGYTKVEIEADGTFCVPADTPQPVIERLKAVGHKPVGAPATEADKGPLEDDMVIDDNFPSITELRAMTRPELYRIGREYGIDFNWVGEAAHSKADMLKTLEALHGS